ncbi:MAG: hypothetical protein ACLFTH_01160 [Candidatus Woesearchaeota archaeon]
MFYGAQGLIHSLQQWGVIDVILPFILIFTIVFAVLEKIQLLSKDEGQNRKYSAIIAIVMAFAVVVPHVTGSYYYGFDVVEIINKALPQVGLLLVAIVMMLLTIGLWTGKTPSGDKGAGVWFTMISAAIVIIIFVASIGWWQAPYWLMRLLNSDIIALVIAILVFGLVIKWISSPGKKSEDNKKNSAMKNFAEFLGSADDKKNK